MEKHDKTLYPPLANINIRHGLAMLPVSITSDALEC